MSYFKSYKKRKTILTVKKPMWNKTYLLHNHSLKLTKMTKSLKILLLMKKNRKEMLISQCIQLSLSIMEDASS